MVSKNVRLTGVLIVSKIETRSKNYDVQPNLLEAVGSSPGTENSGQQFQKFRMSAYISW